MRRDHRQVGYVQNGLILHLDAILNMGSGNAHSNTTTTWYDLSPSGNNVTLINPIWGTDYLTFAGSTRGQTNGNVNLASTNKFTLECWAKTANSGIMLEQTANYNSNPGAFILTPNDPYARRFMLKKPSDYLGGGIENFSDDIFQVRYDDTTNVYTTEIEMFKNAIQQTVIFEKDLHKITSDITLRNAILYIGARAGGVAPFYGSIRNLRIYNRKLTLEELYQNKLEDFRRFGIIK